MTTRIVWSVLIAALMTPVQGNAQAPAGATLASRFVDAANGLSLEEATGRALAQEPSLRAARTGVDGARAMRDQASLRPNPTVSFEQRGEPAGTDHLTTLELEWPLDLFRRGQRVAVADREISAVQQAVADRERLLAAEVRMRYGDVLASVRDLGTLDELVAATERQHGLLRARVDEGATPPLERDLLDVELRRLQADRLLQVGKTEAAMLAVKRVLGMEADAPLTVGETLEAMVRGEPAATGASEPSAVLDQRPDVREAAARIEVADARIERAQAEGRFDVTLFASYMRMDMGFPQSGLAADGGLERVRGHFNYVAAGAMISLPVLNRNQGEVAAAQAARAGAAAAHEAARLTAQAELGAARARDQRARQAVDAYTTGAQVLARRNLDVVSQSYDLGRVTVFDVLAEQRRYLEIERAYTEALRAAYEARTALNRARGGVR
jgi:cobalt-zinc-cadmium efflux system outer membrane protein